MAMQFQEIIELSSHIKISVRSMSCAGNATTYEKLKTVNILVIFLSANFAATMCSQVAIFFHAMATQYLLKIALQSRVKKLPV